MDTPMTEIFPTPSATSTPGGKYDANPSTAFSKPRSKGGIPVKMAETIGARPGKLDSPFTEAIELNAGTGGSQAQAGTMDTPFKAAEK